jgi:alkanesulfonate monooxygenase SsuD/methylene tetrahydromethanopterin reductase-like flavin-dependent oxidoreductase (luciferase family)
MTVHGVIFRPTQPPERLRPTARAAEAAGIDELWLWEDCFEQGGVAAAAAVLASTERLRDVTLHWPPHDPVPVYVAALGPKTVALAGEVADGLVLTSETPLDDLPAVRARFHAARPDGAAPGRVTYYLPASEDAAAVAAQIEQFAAAGADAVVPFSAPDEDPEAFVRYLAEAVLPRVR